MIETLNAKPPVPGRSAAALAGAAALGLLLTTGAAQAEAPPVLVPATLRHITPPPGSVTSAIETLSAACDSWPKSRMRNLAPEPASPSRLAPEGDICDFVADPNGAATSLLWMGAACGAAATVLGLIGFAFLRAILAGLWTWRPRARSPQPGTPSPW